MRLLAAAFVCNAAQIAGAVSADVFDSYMAALAKLSETRMAEEMERQSEERVRQELARLQVGCC